MLNDIHVLLGLIMVILLLGLMDFEGAGICKSLCANVHIYIESLTKVMIKNWRSNSIHLR